MKNYQKTSLISVDEAVAKGRQMLLLPRILLIGGLFIFMFFLALLFIAVTEGPPFTTKIWLISAGVIVVSFFIFFYLPFLYWVKTTTRWKLWAFDNVDNVHELKIMALEASLYPAYGTVMDKVHRLSADQREQWRELQNRFDFPNVFKDDTTIPYTTNIHYSRVHMIITVLFGSIFVAAGCFMEYFAINHNGRSSLKIVAIVIAAAPLYMMFMSVKRMLNKKPELILSNQGLYTASAGLLDWDLIFNEQVTRTYRGRRGVKYTLSFQHPGGIENIDISDFNISKGRLEKLIRIYKGRYASGIR